MRKVDEPTKPSATMVANVGPPAPTEGQTKKKDVEDVKVGDPKRNGDEDAMDVEQTPIQNPLLKETTRHANERSPHHPTPISTDKEIEDAPHVR